MPYATVYNPQTGQRKKVRVGDPNAFAGGFQLADKNSMQGGPAGTAPLTRPEPSESDRLQALIAALTPKPVDQAALSGRFSSLFDPTYQANEQDITKELDLRTSRFGEDAATAAARLAQNRALALGQTREQQAAGGASGMLADEQLARQLRPYDESAQDASVQSGRFATDTEEERRRRLLQNKQARSTALAGYTSDPSNLYEFSF